MTKELKEMLQGWLDDINSAPETILEGLEPRGKFYQNAPEAYEDGFIDGFQTAIENTLKQVKA